MQLLLTEELLSISYLSGKALAQGKELARQERKGSTREKEESTDGGAGPRWAENGAPACGWLWWWEAGPVGLIVPVFSRKVSLRSSKPWMKKKKACCDFTEEKAG